MKKGKVINSNYELLRVIAMIFIVIWHVIIHGNLIERTTGAVNFVINAMLLFVIVHVNIFMLLTGYYQSKSKFKLKKLLQLILEIWFYNFTINTILYFSGLVEYSKIQYILKASFFDYTSYWYVQCYLIIYLLSPFLNRFINECDRVQLKKLILVLMGCFSFIPFLTGNLTYNTNGFNVLQYIMLYFVGSYIRKYDLNMRFLCKFNVTQKRLIFILTFMLSWLINLMMNYFAVTLSTMDSSILNYLSQSMSSFKYYYSNPLVIIQALSLFLLFGTLSFSNKFINKLGGLMFGIYLIHESYGLKMKIYRWLGIYSETLIKSKVIFSKMVIAVLVIFLGSLLIEILRKLIFKLLDKLKVTKKLKFNLLALVSNILEIKN